MSTWHWGSTFVFRFPSGAQGGAETTAGQDEELEVFLCTVTEPYRRKLAELCGTGTDATRFLATSPRNTAAGFAFEVVAEGRERRVPLQVDYGDLWSEWWAVHHGGDRRRGRGAVLAFQEFHQHLVDQEAEAQIQAVEVGKAPQRSLAEIPAVSRHPRVQAWREQRGAFTVPPKPDGRGRPKGLEDSRWLKLLCWAQFYYLQEFGGARLSDCCLHTVHKHSDLAPRGGSVEDSEQLRYYFDKYVRKDREAFLRLQIRLSNGFPTKLD